MIKWLTLLLLLPVGMASAAHHCVGKLNLVDIGSPAIVHVNVAGIGDGNRLCSVSEQVGEFTPEGCRAVLATLLSAQAAGKNVRLYFSNDTNTGCYKGNWLDFSRPEHGFYYLRVE